MIETKGLTGAQSMLRVLAKMGVEKIFASRNITALATRK